MMQIFFFVIIFNCIACIPSTSYGMEAPSNPNIIEPINTSRATQNHIYYPINQTEVGTNPYNVPTEKYPSVYDAIKNAEKKRSVPNNPIIHETTIPASINPELYTQNSPSSEKIIYEVNANEKGFSLSETFTPKTSDTLLKIIIRKTISKFISQAQQNLFIVLKKNLQINSTNKFIQVTFANIIAEYLKNTLFNLSNIPLSMSIPHNNSYNNFKSQLQYIANQIEKSNKTSSSPDQMLTLIQCINQFLKESNIILFSQTMFTRLNELEATASNCCDIIRNKNLIFTSIDIPKNIMIFFKSVIDNTNKLSNIPYTQSIMHAIYDTNGYIDNIMNNWKAFKSSDLNTTAINNQYAAFLTLLLLFENSIVAAAVILDETSALYKVTNPIPVIINIV